MALVMTLRRGDEVDVGAFRLVLVRYAGTMDRCRLAVCGAEPGRLFLDVGAGEWTPVGGAGCAVRVALPPPHGGAVRLAFEAPDGVAIRRV